MTLTVEVWLPVAAVCWAMTPPSGRGDVALHAHRHRARARRAGDDPVQGAGDAGSGEGGAGARRDGHIAAGAAEKDAVRDQGRIADGRPGRRRGVDREAEIGGVAAVDEEDAQRHGGPRKGLVLPARVRPRGSGRSPDRRCPGQGRRAPPHCRSPPPSRVRLGRRRARGRKPEPGRRRATALSRRPGRRGRRAPCWRTCWSPIAPRGRDRAGFFELNMDFPSRAMFRV